MGILARLRLPKIRTTARPNLPDMPQKRTKKVRLGISIQCKAYTKIAFSSQDTPEKNIDRAALTLTLKVFEVS